MRRREFITLIGGTAATWPLLAGAQQPGERMRRIGVLMAFAESDHEAQSWVAAFREELRKLGWTEGRNSEIDTTTYVRMIEFQIREGSHGILVNGTTSEPASLTTDERNRLVTLAMEVINGRVPVVAATGSQSLAETRVLTDHAVKAGVDALLIVTPYYSRPPQRGMIQTSWTARPSRTRAACTSPVKARAPRRIPR